MRSGPPSCARRSARTGRAFLAGGEEAWREAGLSRPKQRALVAVSEAVLEGRLDLDGLCAASTAGKALAEMTAIKGIGPWTAEVYLLFAAGHPDIFPAGDVALQGRRRRRLRPVRPSAERNCALWPNHGRPGGVSRPRLFWAFYAAARNRAVIPRLTGLASIENFVVISRAALMRNASQACHNALSIRRTNDRDAKR
jgi:DNA-3-methyladenine glycosylase II